MKTVNDFDWKNKKALVRVDFNVPIGDDGEVSDATRIKRAVPTIKAILDKGGAAVLMSHLGRPKGEVQSKYSLSQIADDVAKELDCRVCFVFNCVGSEVEAAVAELNPGQVLLLENLRFHPEEKKGEEAFAKKLAGIGADVYINDAFGTAHRAHASTSTIAKYFDSDSKGFGLLMAAEVENASKVLSSTEKPVTAILGGAKVSDKILIIENLLDKADRILIGGGMAYTFIAATGGSIGKSLVESDKLDLAREILAQAALKGVEIVLPPDSIVADEFAADANSHTISSRTIGDKWMGLDIGNEARGLFHEKIMDSKIILWNGPVGVFEMEAFRGGTLSVAHSIAQATDEGAFSLVGGGDSVAAINELGFESRVSYVSTGGGALLEFFEGKELPGIAAMRD